MKAIAINGSPRKGGNTEILLKRVLEPIAKAGIETELVQIGGHPVRGCVACGQCREKQNRLCSNNSDLVNEVITKMFDADAIILGSPTYFANVTAEMKALMDRAGYVALANGGLFKRKVGAAVVVNRRGGANNTFDAINHLFLMNQMIVPGSIYWNFGVGREKGEVEGDEEALRNMADLGETITWLLTNLKGC
ncbi:MAG: flavodoxin family protein [Chthoniobacteraceae bacterium]